MVVVEVEWETAQLGRGLWRAQAHGKMGTTTSVVHGWCVVGRLVAVHSRFGEFPATTPHTHTVSRFPSRFLSPVTTPWQVLM